jgi:DnaJ-class molecular chaperone
MGIEKLPSGREGKGELETCPRCSGRGKASGNDPCGRCHGTRKIPSAR